MICAIFYTNQRFRSREKVLTDQLYDLGFDKVIPYTREWLETTGFYLENREILDMPTGNGYWLWKPYIILETMRIIDNNDIVFYMDAGDDICNPDIINMIKHCGDYMLSRVLLRTNMVWTKKDCFILTDCDAPKYWHGQHVEAGTLVFRKKDHILAFLNEWLFYCRDKDIITDIPSKLDIDYPGLRAHRHDQSILSLLAIKYDMGYSEKLYSYIRCNIFTP